VLRFHALRHGAGSLVARQADPRWVQGFLGHSKLSTTERYLHAKARPQDVQLLNLAFAAAEPAPQQEKRLPADILRVWDRKVNDYPASNENPNRVVLAGANGQPASREELLQFARDNNAGVARERTHR